MAEIRSVGPGRKTTGSVDGIVYVHVNGKTYAKSAPIMPKGMYNTPEAKKRQALFALVMMHIKFHRGEFNFLFDKGSSWSPSNAYHKRNAKALRAALDTLADRMVAGDMISNTEVENAIATYATANPYAIVLADKAPYAVTYLTGSWPATITLSTASGTQTTIVHINNGVSDTVFPPAATDQPVTPPGGDDDDAIGE